MNNEMKFKKVINASNLFFVEKVDRFPKTAGGQLAILDGLEAHCETIFETDSKDHVTKNTMVTTKAFIGNDYEVVADANGVTRVVPLDKEGSDIKARNELKKSWINLETLCCFLAIDVDWGSDDNPKSYSADAVKAFLTAAIDAVAFEEKLNILGVRPEMKKAASIEEAIYA